MSLDVMKQALEALELLARYENPATKIQVRKPRDGGSIVTMYPHKVASEAATALRAAIEQAQPELEQAMTDAIIGGTGVMLGDRRIDPASIYKQPEQEPIAWVYPEGLEALKSGKPWTAYGGSGDGSHSDGVQRIPLYLNDAVAPRAEPRLGGSGAGFESLPASPNQPEKNT